MCTNKFKMQSYRTSYVESFDNGCKLFLLRVISNFDVKIEKTMFVESLFVLEVRY